MLLGSFHSPFGEVKLTPLSYFARTLAEMRIAVATEKYSYQTMTGLGFAFSDDDYKALSTHVPEATTVTLPEIGQIGMSQMYKVKDNPVLYIDLVNNLFIKFIMQEFNTMVAQKTPEFFVKDLSQEVFHELALEYAKRHGSDCYGVYIELSEYQKFLAFIDINDLHFVVQNYVEPHIAATTLRGKVINMRPDKWVLGRYENLTYFKDVMSKMRYDASSEDKDETV